MIHAFYNRQVYLFALAVLLFILGAGLSFAEPAANTSSGAHIAPHSREQHGGTPWGPTGGAKCNWTQWKARHEAEENKILDQLNLSTEQRQKIENLKKEAHKSAESGHLQMRAQRKVLEAYVFSPGATLPEAEAKIDQSSQQMARLGKQRVRTLFKMKEIMTPEQFEKYGALQQQRWKHHGTTNRQPGQRPTAPASSPSQLPSAG
jgi:Spy/CpxP family protein refolding chaperone